MFKLIDLIKKELKLNKSQLRVFMYGFKKKERFDVYELIDKFNIDRTTLQRTINKLLDKGLLVREQQNLHKGFKYWFKVEYDVKERVLLILNDKLIDLQLEFNKLRGLK